MGRVLSVAVVGCGIGRSHIAEGYVTNPERFRVAAVTLLPTLLRGRSAVGSIAVGALGILAYGIYRENMRKDDPPAE